MLRRLFSLLFLLAATVPAFAEPAHKLLESELTSVNPRYLLAGPGGQAISDESFRGRFQLISFGYTYCPDICPTTLVEMAEILKQLGDEAPRVQAIFVSVDPERDTLAVLKNYTAFFDPRILGLTGSPELVQRAARNFKVRYAKVSTPGEDPGRYAVDHSAGMYLLGPEGSFIKKFAYGRPINEVIAEIRDFLHNR